MGWAHAEARRRQEGQLDPGLGKPTLAAASLPGARRLLSVEPAKSVVLLGTTAESELETTRWRETVVESACLGR